MPRTTRTTLDSLLTGKTGYQLASTAVAVFIKTKMPNLSALQICTCEITVETGIPVKNIHFTSTYLPYTLQCRSVDVKVNHSK